MNASEPNAANRIDALFNGGHLDALESELVIQRTRVDAAQSLADKIAASYEATKRTLDDEQERIALIQVEMTAALAHAEGLLYIRILSAVEALRIGSGINEL